MKVSLDRQVALVVGAGPLFSCLLPLWGCNKDKVAPVSAADAAVQVAKATDAGGNGGGDAGALACIVGDAPQRTLSDAITTDAIMQAMTLAADWQLANPAKWATNLWHYAAFWFGMTKLAPLAESPKYYDAL
jgi:hypothetical protein